LAAAQLKLLESLSMKFLALALPLLVSPAFAAQQIITFAPSVETGAQARLIESRGGRIIKEFSFINAVLAELPDALKAADLARSPGVTGAENDEEIYWLGTGKNPLSLQDAQAALPAIAEGEQPMAGPPAVSTPPAPVSPPYINFADADGKFDHLPWSAGRLQVTRVWPRTMGKGARIAVLDTGVDCSHPDLAPNCAPGYNALNPASAPSDDGGHGTHVAGIIAGARNGKGMAGIAPEATILPVKVLNSSGTGKVSNIIDGIGWAMRQNIDIINMSLGAPKYSGAQEKAVEAARKAGILVVCAAGNDKGRVNYPAAYEATVAVTAMDFSNKITSFSSRGPETDFIAPGVRIFSAFPGGSFRLMAGTSQAAPHISGMAALAVGLGIKGAYALKAELTKGAVNVGLSPEEQGAGAPVAAFMAQNILAAQQPAVKKQVYGPGAY